MLLCERLGWLVTPFDLESGPLREQPADTVLFVQGLLGVFEEQKAKSERRMMRKGQRRRSGRRSAGRA